MDFEAGIQVTLIGMGLTFAALTILMLAIIALDRIFRPPSASTPDSVIPTQSHEESGAIVAAIATALTIAMEEQSTSYPPDSISVLTVRRRPTAWKAYYRLHTSR